jgi:hypothetical protein
MSQDIRDLITRLEAIEEGITPARVTKGLNPQQQTVPQLPALFKPRRISVLKNPKDPQHPARGYAVGSNESADDARPSLAETMGEIEEDMLSKVKKDLTQYLDRLEKKMHVDRDLRDKAVDAIEKGQAEEDQDVAEDPTAQDSAVSPPPVPQQDPTLPESAAVKTMTLEDGSVFEIHGDQDRGFEVRHRGRCLPTRFPNIDHAQMAVDLFGSRRRRQDQDQDYLEER